MKLKTIFALFFLIITNNLLSQQASIVIVDSIINENIDQTIPIIGNLTSKKETNIMASVSGVIDKVYIEEGEIVKKGQLLAKIDYSNFKLLYEIAKSNETKASANYKISKLKTLNNKLDLDRMTALQGSSAFNKSKFDNLKNMDLILKSEEQVALSDLNVRKSQKNIANLNLNKSQLKALYDGTIENKLIEAGEVVSIGTKMFKLISKNNLEVVAEVPSNRTFNLSVDDEIAFSTSDGIKLKGKIRAIGNKENIKTRTLKIFLDFNNNPKNLSRSLLSDESVNLLIPIAKGKNSLTIHKDAILKREGMSLAYIVKKDIVEIRPLKLGEAVGNRFVVVKGVKAMDQVVIKGNERLRPGQKVSIKK